MKVLKEYMLFFLQICFFYFYSQRYDKLYSTSERVGLKTYKGIKMYGIKNKMYGIKISPYG